MKEKTIEEIKAAVLSECERVCPNVREHSSFGDVDYLRVDRDHIGFDILRYTETFEWEIFIQCHYRHHPRETCWQFAYKILGLEARDAVKEKDAEIAALVEALEVAKMYCENGNGRGGATRRGNDWYNEGEGTLYHTVLVALQNHHGIETMEFSHCNAENCDGCDGKGTGDCEAVMIAIEVHKKGATP